MKKCVLMCLGIRLLMLALAGVSGAGDDGEKYWPQWRGPRMNGVAPHGNPPVEWSETKNLKWKVEIPGKGSATPVIWGDKIFVLTAIPPDKPTAGGQEEVGRIVTSTPQGMLVSGAGGPGAQPVVGQEQIMRGQEQRRGPRGIQPEFVQKFTILALGRKDGKILWQRVLREELPHEGTHPTNTWASSSAATDGKYVFAYFGSRGLYCLEMNGKLVWEKDLGDMTTRLGFGEGSSPALADDRIVINWDHESGSFIVALDKKTGRELWRKEREEKTTWATPHVVEHNGRRQVITSATHRVRSYDLESGELLWETTGLTANPIPSPVSADGMVYVMTGHRGYALLAIRLAEAKGDLTGTSAIAWRYDRDTPYVPSPLLYGDELYILKSTSGILTVFEAKTGKKHYGEQRLDAVPNVYASPVGAGGRVYIAGREGAVAVLERGPQFKLLAVNQLDDGFDASPVVVGEELYLRGRKYLYRISKD